MGVNVAAAHLQSAGFVSWLSAALAEFPGLDPCQLDLEILETMTLSDLAQSVTVIRECRQLGVTFSLDDFGTGYSSLSYLRQLPTQTLKIDREFVSGGCETTDGWPIVKGIVGLAAAFGRQLVAEGVETAEQADMLLRLGCEYAQGYFISPPLPADQFEEWLAIQDDSPHWRAG